MIILVADCGIGVTIAETILRQKNGIETVVVVDDLTTKTNDSFNAPHKIENSLILLAEEFIENQVIELNAIKRDIDEYLFINTGIEHQIVYKKITINTASLIADAENLECPIRGSPA